MKHSETINLKAINGCEQTKEDLQSQSNVLKAILDTIPCHVYIFDFSTQSNVFSSQFLCSLLGYTVYEFQEFSNKIIETILHPDDIAIFNEIIKKIMVADDNEVIEGEYRFKHKEGNWITIHDRVSVFTRASDGSPLQIIGSALDVTKRKVVEKELEASAAMLNRAEKISHIGTWELCPATMEIVWSDELYNIFGLQKTNPMDLLNLAMEMVHPDDRKHAAEVSQTAIAQKKSYNVEYRVLLADKTIRNAITRGEVICDSKGDIIKVIGTVQDITENKRTEQELQKTQRLESLGYLAGGIAHDFNNLLGGIFGNIELAKNEIDGKSQAAKYLDKSLAVLDRTKDLTQQLLTFSKGGDPRKSVLGIESLLEESCAISLSGSNIEYEVLTGKKIKALEADPNQLSQVLNNILLNARQAMPDGGKVTIATETQLLSENHVPGLSAREYLKITVKDGGLGIPESLIHKVFDPFFSTKQTGSGLGLATCYSIIRKHAGAITIDSEIGKGTTVSIYLPTTDSTVEQKVQVDAKPIQMDGRILVMDDEEMMRDVAKGILEMLGFEVVCTSDGKEAVEVYEECMKTGKSFDCVLLDLTIAGGIGGEQAMSEIHKIDPKALGIVASGYADSPVLANPEKYEFAGKIEKPFQMTEFAKVFEKVLKKQSKE
ncbi:MAG: PAS domain-containing protein [Fibrobacterales bacterium]